MLRKQFLEIAHPILPSQFYDLLRAPGHADSGLGRLQLGVFESGMREYLLDPHQRPDVRNWIGDADAQGPFGFSSICESFGLNPECARVAMKHWMARVDRGEIVARHDSADLRLRGLTDQAIRSRPKTRGRYKLRGSRPC